MSVRCNTHNKERPKIFLGKLAKSIKANNKTFLKA